MSLFPLLLTYLLVLVLAREVWVRRRPPGRHRPSTVHTGMSGWQGHAGLQDGDVSVFRT